MPGGEELRAFLEALRSAIHRCEECRWLGIRALREVNYCSVHKRRVCRNCFFAGRC